MNFQKSIVIPDDFSAWASHHFQKAANIVQNFNIFVLVTISSEYCYFDVYFASIIELFSNQYKSLII